MGRCTIYVDVSLQDMSDLCSKGADWGVKASAPSCPLYLQEPLYPGLPAEQADYQGTLLEGVTSASVEIQTVPIVVETTQRIQKLHTCFYGINFMSLLGEM